MAKPSKQQNKRRVNDFNDDQPTTDRGTRRKSAQHKANEAWHRPALKCMNEAQERYLQCIKDNVITFGVGPAGTGKTHVAMKYAAMQLDVGNYKQIVVLRPLIEVGKPMGALPGELHEKMAPWAEPFLKVLREHYGDSAMQAKFAGPYPSLAFVAIQFIRGRTFDDCIVVLDEGQNVTTKEMKTILTRLGQNSKLIINGDIEQVDIREPSGMIDGMRVLSKVANVDTSTFVEEDIVRSGICKAILIAYREDKKRPVKK